MVMSSDDENNMVPGSMSGLSPSPGVVVVDDMVAAAECI